MNIIAIIIAAKRLEKELNLANQYQNTYSLKEKVIQLSEQIMTMQEQSVKILIY